MKKTIQWMLAVVLVVTVFSMTGTKTEAAGKVPKVTVTTSVLNVRENATISSKRVGQIKRGEVFNYRGKVGAWIKIGYKGSTYYIHGNYAHVSYYGSSVKPLGNVATKPVGKSSYKMKMNTSAYTPFCVGCSGVTASGVNVKSSQTYKGYKIIAAPKQFAFGTKMYIPGFGHAIVLDRGGAITGNKLDLLVGTKSQAYAWGRKSVTVTVYR